MFERQLSVLDEYVAIVQSLIEKYGWYVVFTCIALYILQPYIKNYQKKRSIEIANDPKRVEVLKRDMQYARLKQQKELYLQKQNEEKCD